MLNYRRWLDKGLSAQTGAVHQGAGPHQERKVAGGEKRNRQTLKSSLYFQSCTPFSSQSLQI